MLDVRYWRDTANRYEDDPSSDMVSAEARRRLMYLSLGVKDALRLDLKDLNQERLASVDPKDVWSFSGKNSDTKDKAAEFNALLKGKTHGKD
jgi:hypothetical protein